MNFQARCADRDRILNTLYELDFDYDLGKIPEEDYQQQRAHAPGKRGAHLEGAG